MNNTLNLSNCVADVCDATGLSPPVAKALLERNNWQLNPERAIDKSIDDVESLEPHKKHQLKRIACNAGQAGIGNFLGSLLDNYLRDRSFQNRPYDRHDYDRHREYQQYDRHDYRQPYYQPEYHSTPQYRAYSGPPPAPESDLATRYRELEEQNRELQERLNQVA